MTTIYTIEVQGAVERPPSFLIVRRNDYIIWEEYTTLSEHLY